MFKFQASPSNSGITSSPKPYFTPPKAAVRTVITPAAAVEPPNRQGMAPTSITPKSIRFIDDEKSSPVKPTTAPPASGNASRPELHSVRQAEEQCEGGEEEGELDSSAEYGIHTFGQPVGKQPAKSTNPPPPASVQQPVVEERPVARQEVRSQREEAAGEVPKTPVPLSTQQRSVVVTPAPSSVKALLNRWEISSATGTPLAPDSSNEELLDTAVKMALTREGTGRHPVKRNFQLPGRRMTYQQIVDSVAGDEQGGEARAKSARLDECTATDGEVVEEGDLDESERDRQVSVSLMGGGGCGNFEISDV